MGGPTGRTPQGPTGRQLLPRDTSKDTIIRRRISNLFGGRPFDLLFQDFLTNFSIAGSNNAGSGGHRSDIHSCASAITSTGATDQGQFLLYQSANANQEHLPTGSSAEWYISSLMMLDYASHASPFGGLTDANVSAFIFGHRGPSSSAGWSIYANGVALSGGTRVANQYARLEAARLNGLTSFWVDGILVGSSASVYPTADTDVQLCLTMNNGGSGAARRVNVDDFVVAKPSNRLVFP